MKGVFRTLYLENHSSGHEVALIRPTVLGELDIDKHLFLQHVGQFNSLITDKIPHSIPQIRFFCNFAE